MKAAKIGECISAKCHEKSCCKVHEPIYSYVHEMFYALIDLEKLLDKSGQEYAKLLFMPELPRYLPLLYAVFGAGDSDINRIKAKHERRFPRVQTRLLMSYRRRSTRYILVLILAQTIAQSLLPIQNLQRNRPSHHPLLSVIIATE